MDKTNPKNVQTGYQKATKKKLPPDNTAAHIKQKHQKEIQFIRVIKYIQLHRHIWKKNQTRIEGGPGDRKKEEEVLYIGSKSSSSFVHDVNKSQSTIGEVLNNTKSAVSSKRKDDRKERHEKDSRMSVDIVEKDIRSRSRDKYCEKKENPLSVLT